MEETQAEFKNEAFGPRLEGNNSQWGQSALAPWLWSFSSVTDCGRLLVLLIKHKIRLSNGHAAAKIQRLFHISVRASALFSQDPKQERRLRREH